MRRKWYSALLIGAMLLAVCSQTEGMPTESLAEASATPTRVDEIVVESTRASTAEGTLEATSTPTIGAPIRPVPTQTIAPTATPPTIAGVPGSSPVPTPPAAQNQEPSQPELLYSTGFSDGRATDWSLARNWEVSEQDGDFALQGRGNGQAIFERGSDWTNYVFRFRMKVVSGEVNINYKLNNDEHFSRYYLSFTEDGFGSVTKEDGGNFTGIAPAARGFDVLGEWHTVEIEEFGGRLGQHRWDR